MVVNLAHCQLNRENYFYPVPFAPKNLASRDTFVRPSRPASARSLSPPKLNLVSRTWCRRRVLHELADRDKKNVRVKRGQDGLIC